MCSFFMGYILMFMTLEPLVNHVLTVKLPR